MVQFSWQKAVGSWQNFLINKSSYIIRERAFFLLTNVQMKTLCQLHFCQLPTFILNYYQIMKLIQRNIKPDSFNYLIIYY
jgi:hypothetical protein